MSSTERSELALLSEPSEADPIEDLESGLEPLEFESFTLEPMKPRERTKLTTHQATLRYGRKNSSHIVAQEKTKAALANREIIRRLMQNPAGFKVGELNFIAGTAVDKVAKKERWDRAGEDAGKGFIEQFVGAIARIQADTTLKLELTVATGAPSHREEIQLLPAIDVTPRLAESTDLDARAVPKNG